jgi:3D (Asp-Asp-Asp) domain-containing protein
LSAFTSNFAKLDFYPAFSVKVTADNKTQNIILAKGTVSDVLQKAGITLGENDEINDPVDLTVSSGTNIVVKRVVYKTVTQDSSIGYPTITTSTTLLKKNSQKVMVKGQNGVSETISKETYIDGVLTDQQVISQNIVSQPVPCSMLVGTAANTPISPLVPPSDFSLSSNGTPLKYSKVIHGIATGYSPVDGKYCSTNHLTQVGYVAVNPNVIPYGTALYIMTPDGSVVYGYAKAYDTGGFVNNGSGVTVDLYFNTYDETNIFGRRNIDIYVLS